MQIFGCIKNNKNIFKFYCVSSIDKKLLSKDTHNIQGKKIFVYIDGSISKLSDEIIEITSNDKSLERKLARLYCLGVDIQSHICGSFNLFIFDYSSKNFQIIRDTRGTRSIYYANNNNDFLFSSNLNLIINEMPKVTLNQNKLIDFLNWDYASNDETYFQEIYRVIPSYFLKYGKKGLVTKQYELSKELFKKVNYKNSQEKFKEALYCAVNNYSHKEKKIGVMMSGGLDSSSIAIALKENDYHDVRTYSANFNHISDNKDLDESKYQKNVAEYTSFNHTQAQMEGKSTISPIQKFTKKLSQPLFFPNLYLFESVIKNMKIDGIEMILDGNDGDTTISHGIEVIYYYFKTLRLYRYTKEIFLYSKFKNSSFMRLFHTISKQAIKEILNIKPKQNQNSILKENFKIKKNEKNLLTFFSSHKQKLSIDLHFQANENRNELFRLNEIENYSPFYDEELINFCINMPNKSKIYNGYTRKVLRDFLLEFLPSNHANRDKSILTPGLLNNFSSNDLKIVKNEYANLNKSLLALVDIKKIEIIIDEIENGNQLTEEKLISLQMLVSANTFLNHFAL